MVNIHLVHQDITVKVEPGTLLSQACDDAGFPLDLVCGGRGKCGKCSVDILRSGASEEETVLACVYRVEDDMDVWVRDEQISRGAEILIHGETEQERRLDPALTRQYLTRRELEPEYCGAFLREVPISLARKFSRITAAGTDGVTFTRFRGKALDVVDGDQSGTCYGAAVDIGTTSVVLYAYDLVTGRLLHTESILNSQISHGGDVISRILYTLQEPEGLDELSSLIGGCINSLLSKVEAIVPGFCADLWHVILCGNSTMQHLFLNLHPSGLSASPFVSVQGDVVTCSGSDTLLHMNPRGIVQFLPLLGGFVGADTASVLLTLPTDSRSTLMIDLGTNGEIAVGCGEGRFKVASTACGPALEGGNIECGMRGADGAIEKISLQDGKISLRVIGHGKAKGLCGSAIIDATAELLRLGIVDMSGRMLSREEYEAMSPGDPLAVHLKDAGEYNPAFYFTPDVYICQKDIREIQLAKSSICSGCIALLAENDMTPDDVKALYLSGAFGNYIDIDNALYIGLLPPVQRDRIHSIGNGAGLGVQMCLLDQAHLDRAEVLPSFTEHLELATSPRFMEEYIMNMNFWI